MKVHCSFDKMVKLENLLPHPKNPNRHPTKQIKALAKILKYQGWRNPITVSNLSGKIVSGHGRLEAAKINKWTEAPVDFQDFKTEADEFAHLVADNKIAEFANHDDDFMLETIKNEFPDIDTDLLGLLDFELEAFVNEHDINEKESFENSEKQYILEVKFPNDMEMMEVHDDLTHQGYLVKVK